MYLLHAVIEAERLAGEGGQWLLTHRTGARLRRNGPHYRAYAGREGDSPAGTVIRQHWRLEGVLAALAEVAPQVALLSDGWTVATPGADERHDAWLPIWVMGGAGGDDS